MENMSVLSNDDEIPMDLPPGFRFHPTDEELITHYLSPKVLDGNFYARAISEVDLNKVEPWDLPWKAKMGEKEWYFFCIRDRKYPTGSRTNRATQAGYWKATGKDKEIFKAKTLVGMKKTLVFYKGRAPRGEKSNWVMHEYRMDGKNFVQNLPKTARSEWVICRIFKKTSGGKKIHISGLVRTSNYNDHPGCSNLPPLLDISHVPCFSNQTEDHKPLDKTIDVISANILAAASTNTNDFSNVSINFPNPTTPISLLSPQNMPFIENFNYMDSNWMQDHSILKLLLDNNLKQDGKAEYSPVSNHEVDLRLYENQYFPIPPVGSMDIDSLSDY